MNEMSSYILKLFIHHFHPESPDALIKHLSENEAGKVNEQNLQSTELEPLLNHASIVVHRLHPTWLEKVSQKSKLPPQSLGAEKIVLPFIVNTLYASIEQPPKLPLEHLPPTELSSLANYSSSQLEALTDYLGLFDLASELRSIVDKTSIQNIYSSLQPSEITFLKGCLQKKDRLTVPKLGIDPRKNEPEKLRQVLRQRGLLRLSKALAGQHRDLVWYISRSIDYENGTKLFQEYSPKALPEISTILAGQINQVITYLKKIGAM